MKPHLHNSLQIKKLPDVKLILKIENQNNEEEEEPAVKVRCSSMNEDVLFAKVKIIFSTYLGISSFA